MEYKEWCKNAGEAYAILCKCGMRFPGITPGTALGHAMWRTKLLQRWLRQYYATLNGKMTNEERDIVISVVTEDISNFPAKIDDNSQIQVLLGFWQKDFNIKKQKRKAEINSRPDHYFTAEKF